MKDIDEETIKAVANIISEIFDEPCSYSTETEDFDEFMALNCSEFCDSNCVQTNPCQCWFEFLKAKIREKHGVEVKE